MLRLHLQRLSVADTYCLQPLTHDARSCALHLRALRAPCLSCTWATRPSCQRAGPCGRRARASCWRATASRAKLARPAPEACSTAVNSQCLICRACSHQVANSIEFCQPLPPCAPATMPVEAQPTICILYKLAALLVKLPLQVFSIASITTTVREAVQSASLGTQTCK